MPPESGYPTPDPDRAARYRAEGRWRDETIWDRIAAVVSDRGDKRAVIDASGDQMTYSELAEASARVANHLAANGVGPGDIVTVCLPNRTETVAVMVGVLRLGAVVNPLPVANGRAEVSHVLTTCESAALFVPERFRSSDFVDLVAGIDPAVVSGCHLVFVDRQSDPGRLPEAAASWLDVNAAPTDHTPHRADADDPVAVLFTSGTEAQAKGAVHTHNTILFGERVFADALGIGTDDTAFMASPITHTTGFMHGVVLTLTTGGTLSLLDVFTGEDATAQMARHGCTWTMGATPFLGDSAQALETSGRRLPDLRYFLCGGAPIPEVLVRRATELGMRVLSIYGATESPPHTLVHPEDPVENAWLTDGRPLDGIQIMVVDETGAPVPDGIEGEEWSRGPNTFLGYLNAPEQTARAMDPNGWYHSGDLVRVLPDGSIRVTGRLKDVIIRGGMNISVREVEDHLAAHPKVASVAVVAVPHHRLGETACAVVVPAEDGDHPLTLDGLTDFLRARGVATYKLPERLELWPELPMNPSGKIQKYRIRTRLTGDPA